MLSFQCTPAAYLFLRGHTLIAGVAIAIVAGHAPPDTIQRAFLEPKVGGVCVLHHKDNFLLIN